jgi:hypothetical protein
MTRCTRLPRLIALAFGGVSLAGTIALTTAARPAAAPASAAAAMTAGDLRVALNHLLAEHVYLASDATGAALGGRDAEFKAAAAALDSNSVDLSRAIGMVYGADAQTAFLALWRRHIGFVVDYTVGLAKKDQAAQSKAVNALLGYTQDFGAFLSGANPYLPKDVVAGLVKDHILTLKAVIDAQAAGDMPKAYLDQRAAAAHMQMIADPLAGAIAKQFPQKFPTM